MNLVFIRTKVESTVFLDAQPGNGLNKARLEKMKISAKAGSSSKNIIWGIQEKGLFESFEEWKFWGGSPLCLNGDDRFPVRFFPCEAELTSNYMEEYIQANGQPDILWVEGPDYPPYIAQLFDLCPGSFKIVYSKDWRPHKIARLDRYDLCLVDEEWEAKKIKQYYPEVECGIWDKLIDYEHTHYPLETEKIYDICYIGYLRKRKNQKLLIRAMAKLQDRHLRAVCIGNDRKGYQAELEQLAADLGVTVHFAGEVPKEEVNRIVNQSKIGVLCAKQDAVPRAILEYMAADVPVLVNAELFAGARYVGPQAGLVKSPADFHLGIAEMLDNLSSFSPRAYFLEHYSKTKTLAKFIDIWQRAGIRFR
jgi:glycosyltransferase involved in cell wall biosynthesis